MGAMGATIDHASRFDAVANDGAEAMCATGSKRVDGAFEGVKSQRSSALRDLKRLVVLIAANVAPHGLSFAEPTPSASCLFRTELS
jgi:hypothetical protein